MQFSAASQSQPPESPRPTKTPASSLSDKPLPSPPVAQVTTGYIEEPRSLIDASEKPLRRASPKSPQMQEEWPVLFPRKPTSPEAICEITPQTPPTTARAVPNEQERYPLLTGTQAVTANPQQKFSSRVPSSHQIQRKQVSTSSLRESSTRTSLGEGSKVHATDRSTKRVAGDSKTSPAEPRAAHPLSAGSAAVEKSSTEAKSIKEPRQTRTSSLRARISAGQVIRDSPNKVLGFTDFTVEKPPPTKASQEDLGSEVSFRARSSSSFSKAFTKKPSKEFQGGNRAPAQFVAGSRRPAARRSSSRNSLRGDSRAPSPAFLEPSRPAPPVPTAKNMPSTRKSSIPISRNSISAAVTKDDSNRVSFSDLDSAQQTGLSNMASDQSANHKDKSKALAEAQQSKAATDIADYSLLESIAESPQSTFRSKRLSTKSSAYGPMLTISSSANRLIMGDGGSEKENQHLIVKKKSKDLFRAALTNDHKNVSKGRTLACGQKGTAARPNSSQGFTESQSSNSSTARAVGARRTHSVDSSNVGPSSVSSIVHSKSEPTAQANEGNIEHGGFSSTDDPFFDVNGQGDRRAKGKEKQAKTGAKTEALKPAETPSVSFPVEGSATPISDAMPVVPAFLPEVVQEHINKPSVPLEPTRVDEVKVRKAETCAFNLDIKLQLNSDRDTPFTPTQGTQSNGSPGSGSFPPRSSSRMKHPDYTISGSAKSSSVSLAERAAARLQKEISGTQPIAAKLANGEVSHRLSNTDDDNRSRQEISSQTILADVGHKRDSTARESTKSQTSMSKGLMSNFRGLFHKRTSDSTEAPARSTKKGGKRPTVTAHGSPFPSMSNIHPVHRPTQASMNRTSATSQRLNASGATLASPGTPGFTSPIPSEISTTTTMAMQILESARKESSSPKKERLLELGKLMVDTITQARDAEKAMEEARHAARKAEVAHALCKKSVSDVANLVKDWRSDVAHL